MARDIYEIKPTPDWRDPATPKVGGKKRKVYTSGTMYQDETGRYASPGMSGTESPMGHGKKKVVDTGAWNRAKVYKGAKAPGAQRGVGQPTIDGFINQLPDDEKKQAVASFIKKVAADKYTPPRRKQS